MGYNAGEHTPQAHEGIYWSSSRILQFIPMLMVFLLLSAVAGAVYLKINRDTNVMFCSTLVLMAMLFQLILMICLVNSRYTNKKQFHLFCAMLSSTFLAALLYAYASMLTGYRGIGRAVFLLCAIAYCADYGFWIFFWFFQKSYFPPQRYSRRFTALFLASVVTQIVIILWNYFSPFLYSIDSFGRTTYYVSYSMLSIVMLTNYSMPLLVVLYTILCKEKSGVKWRNISYLLFPEMNNIVYSIFVVLGISFDLTYFNPICYTVSLYMIFFNVYAEQSYQLLTQSRKLAQQEQQRTELQTAIMLSQIGPHFLYNSLSCIGGLCLKENAPQAQQAVNKFADYLRANLDSTQAEHFIPFRKELEHIKTYLWLEQMRFGEELRVEYDIQYEAFSLPSLVIQPLVENAVRHGLFYKEDGGTVYICAVKREDGIYITVRDDGVGFDPAAKPADGRSHIGIENVSRRLEILCGGKLTITSRIGEGTTATVFLPWGGNIQ